MIDDEILQTAITRYLAGETTKQIAPTLGVPEATLRAAIEREGVHRPRIRNGPIPKIDGELAERIAEMYRAGQSAFSIANELKQPVTSVRRSLTRLGVPRNPDLVHRVPLTEEEKDLVIHESQEGATLAEMAETVGCSTQTITRVLRERKVNLKLGRPRSCTLDETVFDVLTPVAARWIGFLFADGCLPRDTYGNQAISMNIGAKDRGHVEKFRAFLGSNHKITETLRGERSFPNAKKPTGPKRYVYFKVRSTLLSAAVIARGMIKEKGPLRTPTAELEDSPAFWGGVVDGDGSIGTGITQQDRVIASFSLCGHLPLLEKFQTFLRLRGLADLRITPTQSGIWRIGTGSEPGARIIELLYGDESGPPAALARKIARVPQILSGEKVAPYEEPPVDAIFSSV